jgi:DNA invertase Pin-like site-specific DNA recombinase
VASTRTKAIAYFRTSSAANVGAEKDSDKRQSEAISQFAKNGGYEIIDQFYDAAVSGADPIETRPGFADLLDRIEANGVRTVLIEDASRFARELMTQELGILVLKARGVRILTASGDDLTETHDPFKVAMRQIAGAFAQLEKARLVGKLKAARIRKRAIIGKCEGRKSFIETHPETVELVRKLRRRKPKGGQMSLRDIATKLAELGHLNERGKLFNPKSIAAML